MALKSDMLIGECQVEMRAARIYSFHLHSEKSGTFNYLKDCLLDLDQLSRRPQRSFTDQRNIIRP